MTIREARGWMEYLEDPQGKKSTDMSKLMQHLKGGKMAKGSLFVNIGANISGFKKSLDRSVRMLRGYRKKIARSMPRVPSLGGMAAGLGISIGMAQAFNIMRNASPKFAKSIEGLKEKNASSRSANW